MTRVVLMMWPPIFVKFPTFIEAQHRLVGLDMTAGRFLPRDGPTLLPS